MTKSTGTAFIATVVILFFAAGCATVGNRYTAADTIGRRNNFTKEYITTKLCALTSFHRFTKPRSPLTVYLEGDGGAWRTRHHLSDDPTPRRALVLSLAALDPSENVAYLARPGQLTASERPDCDSVYWSVRRTSREVIDAMNAAIDYLKAASQAEEINVVGFSGGAAIAVIVAAERTDIASIRTIAGGLDHRALTAYHRVTPLEGSLDAIDFADRVRHIPQRHFIGAKDKVVPLSVAASFAVMMGDADHESVTVVREATHSAGWEERWPSLLTLPLYKRPSAR